MTFAIGRRFVIADGVERWKDAEVEAVAAAHAGHGRRDADASPSSAARRARYKVADGARARPSRRPAAQIAEEAASSRWELPRWVVARGDASSASSSTSRPRQALVASVGERQQRLLRELEKLALEHGAGARIGTEEVEASAPAPPSARSGPRRRRSWPATSRPRCARCSSSAARASGSPGCSTRSPAGCATRSRRRGARGRPARAQVSKGLRMPRAWPPGSSRTSASATSTRSAARSR